MTNPPSSEEYHLMPTDQTVENDEDEERTSKAPLVSNRSIALAFGFKAGFILVVWFFLYDEGIVNASPMNLPVYTFDAVFFLAFVAVCITFFILSIIFTIRVLHSVYLAILQNAPSCCAIFAINTAIITTFCGFYFNIMNLLAIGIFGMAFGIPMSLGVDMVDIFVESLSRTLFLCDKCLLSIRLCCCTILVACAPKPMKNEGDEDPLLPVVDGLEVSTVSGDQPCNKRASNRKKSNPTETCIEELGGCNSE